MKEKKSSTKTRLYAIFLKLIKIIIIAFFSCCSPRPACAKSGLQEISIVNWNLQCFFDPVTEGSEYSDFITSKNWNRAAYQTRLERLTESIKNIKADIFVFEEIENQSVLMDISNMLCDYSFNHKKNWNYGVFAKNPGESIGCGVLSRFPIEKYSIHNLDIRSENSKQPAMRPIIRVDLSVNGQKLLLLVNHWKSKSGGEDESEIWRNWQESLLSNLFDQCLAESQNVIACGDFNRDVGEFYRIFYEEREGNPPKQDFSPEDFQESLLETSQDNYSSSFILRKMLPSALSPFLPEECFLPSDFSVKNPWYNKSGKLTEPGSYFYKEEFERIDNFFVSPELFIKSFTPLKGPWCTEDGVPLRYQIYSGQGYSDHLPIMCTIML